MLFNFRSFDDAITLDAALGGLDDVAMLRCLHGETADIGLSLLADGHADGDATVEAAVLGLVAYTTDAERLAPVTSAIQAARDSPDAVPDARASLITAGLTIATCTPTEDT